MSQKNCISGTCGICDFCRKRKKEKEISAMIDAVTKSLEEEEEFQLE